MWKYLYGYMTSFRHLDFLYRIKNWFIVGGYARNYINRHLAFIYQVVTCFIICGKDLMHNQNIFLNNDNIKTIMEEVKHEVKNAELYINNLKETFPHIIQSVQTKRAAQQILVHQKKILKKIKNEGQLEEGEYSDMKKEIDRKIVALESMDFDWVDVDFDTFVVKFPLFQTLSKGQIAQIQTDSENFNFRDKDTIY